MRHHPWAFLAKKIAAYHFTYCFGFGLLLIPGLVYLVRTAAKASCLRL